MITATLLLTAATALPFSPGLAGQAADPDYRFSRAMRAGQTLGIGNIDGSVTVTRTSGGTAEVLVTKRVVRGDGALVQAILEETSNGIRVCTVYLRQAGEQRTSCSETGHNGRRREPLEVTMTYEVRLPSGVELAVGTVDGDIIASGLDAPARLSTVDGHVRVTGRAPDRISTVDGNIELTIDGELPAELRLTTVDGSVRVALPRTAGFTVHATTVDGALTSDFPLTISGKWGPRSLRGTVGDGRSTLRISTVDGSVELRQR